jgi:hypothetical protein
LRLTTRPILYLVAASVLAAGACSGDNPAKSLGKTSGPTGPSDDPTPGPSPSPGGSPSPGASPSPTPSASPSPSSPGSITGSCPFGKGVVNPSCGRNTATLLADVEAAVETLVREKPTLFDLNRTVGTGAYFVRDPKGFYAAMVTTLQAAGFCAAADDDGLQVKNSNDFSERYDLLLSNDHLRRGDVSYRSSCTPAAFPIEPRDMIAAVRVAFYSIRCEDEGDVPRNGEGILPTGCQGFVTATPKQRDNTDVPSEVHGPDITWELVQVDDYVDIVEFPRVPFNKILIGRDPGRFQLCGTVLGVKGCLNGEVQERKTEE